MKNPMSLFRSSSPGTAIFSDMSLKAVALASASTKGSKLLAEAVECSALCSQ